MANQPRIIDEFTRLASIASPSFHEGEIARYLTRRFQELGGDVFTDDAGTRIGAESGNLIVTFPAEGRDSEPLMLSVHMDMVEPAAGVQPVLSDGVFTSAGPTVLGADDKAGIVEIMEAIELLRERGIPRGPLEVVVTVCEEAGLLGAKNLDYSHLRSRRGLALDTTGIDLAIHRAPCADKLRFEIIGRDSHAGIAPERGVSAIETAAHAISAMRLGRIDDETTANIGTIRGGQAINIVPRSVVLEGEVRSHDPDKLKRQGEHMIACFEQAASDMSREIDGVLVRPEIRCEVISDYPFMHVPLESGMVKLVRAAGEAIGHPLTVRAAGGGSDANIFNSHGIETLIIGTGMTHVHTEQESVSVADMERVAEFLVEVMKRA